MKFEVTVLEPGTKLVEVLTFDGPQFELSMTGALRVFEHVGPGARVETIYLFAPEQWIRVRRTT